MPRSQNLDALFNLFHKTRMTKHVGVPPELVYAILEEAGYYPRKISCKYCDDTGYLDYAGFAMDPCTFCRKKENV